MYNFFSVFYMTYSISHKLYFIFIAALHKERERQGIHETLVHHKAAPRELLYPEALMEGDLILQVNSAHKNAHNFV